MTIQPTSKPESPPGAYAKQLRYKRRQMQQAGNHCPDCGKLIYPSSTHCREHTRNGGRTPGVVVQVKTDYLNGRLYNGELVGWVRAQLALRKGMCAIYGSTGCANCKHEIPSYCEGGECYRCKLVCACNGRG